MADDDEDKPQHATARPPPGEEDVYSANTVVGEASDEILAIIRSEAAKGAIPGSPGLPKNLEGDPSPDSKADAKAAEAIKTPVAEPVKFPPPEAVESAHEPAPTPAPAPTPVPVSPPAKADVVAPAPVVTAPLAPTTDEPPNVDKGTLHPAVGIVLFFVAVVIVLAALIR